MFNSVFYLIVYLVNLYASDGPSEMGLYGGEFTNFKESLMEAMRVVKEIYATPGSMTNVGEV